MLTGYAMEALINWSEKLNIKTIKNQIVTLARDYLGYYNMHHHL